jgi:hypothetical protein
MFMRELLVGNERKVGKEREIAMQVMLMFYALICVTTRKNSPIR